MIPSGKTFITIELCPSAASALMEKASILGVTPETIASAVVNNEFDTELAQLFAAPVDSRVAAMTEDEYGEYVCRLTAEGPSARLPVRSEPLKDTSDE